MQRMVSAPVDDGIRFHDSEKFGRPYPGLPTIPGLRIPFCGPDATNRTHTLRRRGVVRIGFRREFRTLTP